MLTIAPKTAQMIDHLWRIHHERGRVTTADVGRLIDTGEKPAMWLKRVGANSALPPVVQADANQIKAEQQAARLWELSDDGEITRRDAEAVLKLRGAKVVKRLVRIVQRGIPVPTLCRNRPIRASGELRRLRERHERALKRLHNERRRFGRPTEAAYRRVEMLEARLMEATR